MLQIDFIQASALFKLKVGNGMWALTGNALRRQHREVTDFSEEIQQGMVFVLSFLFVYSLWEGFIQLSLSHSSLLSHSLSSSISASFSHPTDLLPLSQLVKGKPDKCSHGRPVHHWPHIHTYRHSIAHKVGVSPCQINHWWWKFTIVLSCSDT